MSNIAIEFDHVWKKFKRGEKYDSLRDLIPAMTKRLFAGRYNGELQEKEFWALKDISFQIRRGEAFGIIGPNGSGKSTMLKLISKIHQPNKGNIKVNGKLSALIEVGAGFHHDLTGRENIYLNGAILGMKKEEIDKKFDEIVEFSGLKEFIDTPVKRYSSGMYARLGFSVAAHVDPEILLVDEVLSVGDMQFQQKCLDRMLSISKSGTTVIFVSHQLESVQTLCPKTLYFQNGQLMMLGDTSEAIKEYVSAVRRTDSLTGQSADIDNVMLCDEKGNPTVTFSPGDKAQLKFTVRCDEPLDQCLLGFLVNRATDGLPVCDYNLPLGIIGDHVTHRDEIPVVVNFSTNLLRGAYVISLHIYYTPNSQFLCRIDNITTFSLEERISWRGVSHLNPALEKIE